MTEIRPRTRVFVVILALAALAAGGHAALQRPSMSPERLVIAGAFLAFMVVALLFPLPFAPRTKMTLDTSVIFASMLLLPPAAGILIAVVGTLLGSLIRRRPPVAVLFNGAQRILQAGIGGSLLVLAGWDYDWTRISAGQAAVVPVAAVIMYVINTASVATVVGLQAGEPPVSVWRRSSSSVGLEYLAQLALGLMAAAVVDAHTWALPLLLLPAISIYRSLLRHAQLRQSAAEALRSSEASLAAAQRIAHLGSWNRDLQSDDEQWSDEVYRVFGYTPQQFAPSEAAFLRAIHPEDREHVLRTLETARAGGTPYDIVHRIVLPDGAERIVQQQGEVFVDGAGAPCRMMGTVHDITERARAEHERDSLLAEVEQALEFRNRFLSITSHELKTPITLLKGYAQVLQERVVQRGEHDLVRPLQVINRQTDRMTALIDELLEVSRIESGRIAFADEPFDLRAALMEITSEVAHAGGGAVDVRLHDPAGAVWVRGDRTRVQQVITNLLTNAAKYSPDSDRIDVTLCREGAEAVVAIRDYGIGIPEAQQPHVFDLYYRGANAHAAHSGGLGLGLYISKVILERHGGSIAVSSEESAGSTFSFRLPVMQTRVHALPPAPVRSRAS